MSLQKAVESIVEEMEKDCKERMILLYAKMLRVAMKASENETPLGQGVILNTPPVPPFIQDRLMIESAKEEMRKNKAKQELEEGSQGIQTELVGGPGYDENVPVYAERDNQMPVGGRMFLQDGVYQLRKDGKLHFCAEETARVVLARK